MPSTAMQVRLPEWAKEFLDERAARRNTTKTAVVLEAIRCLRSQELAQLMREGYEEMASTHKSLAEEDLAGTTDSLPDW